MTKKTQTTIKENEINQFQKDSYAWWEENGPFAPLHGINPIRLQFICDTLKESGDIDSSKNDKLLKNKKIIDVGCGGGLLCEPLARLGGTVTGLDADAQAIAVASTHAKQSGLDISYHAQPIEEFRQQNPRTLFDVVTALEIIEHVAEPDLFVAELVALTRPGGIIFMSTLNKTVKSWALGVVAAEYVLGLVPRGTHDWQQFVKPSTMARMLRTHKCEPLAASGLGYNPVTKDFSLTPHDLSVNYIMAFRKVG